jgi:hypothetical protein
MFILSLHPRRHALCASHYCLVSERHHSKFYPPTYALDYFRLLAHSLPGLSFTFTIPQSISQGEVEVQWERDPAQDPVSFGIAQRSLQDNSILDVTRVENSADATSGTQTVTVTGIG